jgi:hypothetical protein
VRHDKFLRVAPPIQRQAATPLDANTAFGQGANSAPDLFGTTSLTLQTHGKALGSPGWSQTGRTVSR